MMHRIIHRSFPALCACLVAVSSPAGPPGGDIVGNMIHPALTEVSGMAPSRLRDDVLWVLNDSGNPAELFAVSTNGTVLARHPVAGIRNRDWEDLASYVHHGTSYLVIGEVGDNGAVHKDCALHVIEEPANAETGDEPLAVTRSIRFRYQDGPRDCESLAVDPAAGRILLLSKRDTPPVLYELPLHPADGGEAVEARRLGELESLPQPTAADLKDRFGEYFSQPTAMDLSPDGRKLVVLTYKNAYLFARDDGESWVEAMAGTPRTVLLPYPATEIMRKREAICFSRDGASVFVTAEGQPAPLFRQEF